MSDQYNIVQYSSVKKAKDSFLDAYFGSGGFDRAISAQQAGLAYLQVEEWFTDPAFFASIETRLRNQVKKRSNLQEQLIEEAGYILSADVTDAFTQNEDGSISILNIKTLPRSITAAIKQMDIVQTVAPGQRRGQFQDCLRIIMHDKPAAMRIVGDYTDIKNNALKTSESGRPAMVGMSLITASPMKGLTDGGTKGESESSDGGRLPDDTSAEDSAG